MKLKQLNQVEALSRNELKNILGGGGGELFKPCDGITECQGTDGLCHPAPEGGVCPEV